jgi:hypothetical protein
MERPVEIIENGKFVLYAEDFVGDFQTNVARLCAEALRHKSSFNAAVRNEGAERNEKGVIRFAARPIQGRNL